MPSLTPREIPVVIVGAGPSGTTAANLLGRQGIACLVVERHHDIYPLPRAVHLDDETLRIMQSAGLADEVRAITRPALGLQLLNADHQPLARFQRDPVDSGQGHPGANMFDQAMLEAVLRRGLARFPHVDLRCGAEAVAVETGHTHGPAPLRVTIRDHVSGRLEQVWTHAVLGCDGANGSSRATVGTTMEDLRFTQSWLVVDVHSEQPLANWDGIHQVCDRRRAATYMRIGPRRYRWEFQIRAGESAHELSRIEVVRQLVAPWLGGVDPRQLTVVRQTAYTFHALVARRWRRGRVFLLGDAAHQTPPFLGQGLCAGVRDAANLTWKLGLVLAGHADERLLDSYQSERRPHARQLVRMAVMLGRTMTSGTTAVGTARQALFVQAAGLDAFQRLMERSASPPLRPGPLVRPASRLLPGRRQPAGRLCPQPLVRTAAGAGTGTAAAPVEIPLDDLLGDGFAVLAHCTDWIFAFNWASVVGEDTRAFFARLRTRYVGIVPAPAPLPATSDDVRLIHDPSGALDRWLTRHRAHAVLLRPDRTVFATARTLDLIRWRHELASAGMRDIPPPARLAGLERQPQQSAVSSAGRRGHHARTPVEPGPMDLRGVIPLPWTANLRFAVHREGASWGQLAGSSPRSTNPRQ
ncbi:monooxygenase FAD-binding protein [Candidatus Protofrankia datiscae]|uniref:Monooxygenase FAD-binding protein n=1 Tax=Candidatus Protofrankia datiscae TaxID=2716812 RepID=F8AXR0_9ACTN|nr:bifunctional 3-(3-hydroxy-phenyl)propionate/3-hydroxycinnamic acid hydroxylase [Candidatus Protofrankia datiscae]AEH11478.1 monooxygenase FAD-binding protein [Candidatus Protofrankia datiscae]